MDLFTLTATLKLDTSDYEEKIADVVKSAQEAGKTIDDALNGGASGGGSSGGGSSSPLRPQAAERAMRRAAASARRSRPFSPPRPSSAAFRSLSRLEKRPSGSLLTLSRCKTSSIRHSARVPRKSINGRARRRRASACPSCKPNSFQATLAPCCKPPESIRRRRRKWRCACRSGLVTWRAFSTSALKTHIERSCRV